MKIANIKLEEIKLVKFLIKPEKNSKDKFLVKIFYGNSFKGYDYFSLSLDIPKIEEYSALFALLGVPVILTGSKEILKKINRVASKVMKQVI